MPRFEQDVFETASHDRRRLETLTPQEAQEMLESQDEAAVLMALMRHGFVKVKGWIAHYEGSTVKGAK